MKCSDLQLNLSLYTDGSVSESETVTIEGHLKICPLCRQKYDEYREMRSALRQLRRPAISVDLKNNIRSTVRSEITNRQQSLLPVTSEIREWLQMRVMPYGVGVVASVLIGVTFLTMMFSGRLKPIPDLASNGDKDGSVMLASNSMPPADDIFLDDVSDPITATDFAQSRLGFAKDSPSVNPQGGLMALTKAVVRGGMKDEEVVVVADVFSNGLATITEVVESPRDRKVMDELEKAFKSDASRAPFVPSVLEHRPESMRIVLKLFQSVDVSTGSKPVKRRS